MAGHWCFPALKSVYKNPRAWQLAQYLTDDQAPSHKMKTIVALCALVAVALARPEDTYSDTYDNFNADELVENIRLLKNYGKCFLDQGPCTPEGSDFKKRIPEALKTDCAKCSPKQRELIRTVVKGFQSKLPEVWAELVKKHDPEGTYKESFDAFLHSTN